MTATSTACNAPGAALPGVQPDRSSKRRISARLERAISQDRGYWGTLDQAVSSATNIIPALLLARALEVREFSAFAAVSATAALAAGLARALVGDPLLVRAATFRAGDRRLVRSAQWSAAALGLVVAAACAVASRMVAGDLLRDALLAYAIVVTGILMQDVSRYVMFASFRHRAACMNDLVWLALVLGGFLAWTAGGRDLSVTVGIVIWGIAGGVAAGVAVAQLGGITWVPPQRFLAAVGPLGAHFVVQFLAVAGVAQLALYLLGVVADLEAIGAVRATQLLFGPMNIVFLGAYVTLLPKGLGHDLTACRSAMVRASALLSGGAAVCTLVLVALPTVVGEALLGDTWGGVRPLIVPYGLYLMTVTVATGAWVGLAALERARTLSLLRLGSAPVTLITSLAGGFLWGGIGFMYGLAGAGVPIAVACWTAFNRSARGGDCEPHATAGHGERVVAP